MQSPLSPAVLVAFNEFGKELIKIVLPPETSIKEVAYVYSEGTRILLSHDGTKPEVHFETEEHAAQMKALDIAVGKLFPEINPESAFMIYVDPKKETSLITNVPLLFHFTRYPVTLLGRDRTTDEKWEMVKTIIETV